MHLTIEYTRSPVTYLGLPDMHLCVMKRVLGGPDTTLPRYFLGVGGTRDAAERQALETARTLLGEDVRLVKRLGRLRTRGNQ